MVFVAELLGGGGGRGRGREGGGLLSSGELRSLEEVLRGLPDLTVQISVPSEEELFVEEGGEAGFVLVIALTKTANGFSFLIFARWPKPCCTSHTAASPPRKQHTDSNSRTSKASVLKSKSSDSTKASMAPLVFITTYMPSVRMINRIHKQSS